MTNPVIRVGVYSSVYVPSIVPVDQRNIAVGSNLGGQSCRAVSVDALGTSRSSSFESEVQRCCTTASIRQEVCYALTVLQRLYGARITRPRACRCRLRAYDEWIVTRCLALGVIGVGYGRFESIEVLLQSGVLRLDILLVIRDGLTQ